MTITSGATTVYTKDLTGATPVRGYNLIHWNGTRWSREFWIGGTPPQQLNIDYNLSYLDSTHFLPNLDTSINLGTLPALNYPNYLANPHDIYDGQWDSRGPWAWADGMGQGGDSLHIGPFPTVTALWLHSADWRMRYMALNHTDLAAAWPLDWRESDPSRRFSRADAIGSGTGLGRTISAAGRPQTFNGPDDMTVVGTITAATPWTAGTDHQPSVYFAPYIPTGDPWYLDMMYAWAGISVFINDKFWSPYVCTTQAANCSNYRGPTGAYGGFFSNGNAPRDQAWTLRGRVETAFAAPDGAPEKDYFRYMTNDFIAKWEGGLGITGTAFDTTTEKEWIVTTSYPYLFTLGANPNAGAIPPLGNLTASCPTPSPPNALLCSYSSDTQTGFGLLAGANGSFDDPWMNSYMHYALGRAVELGFPMQQIMAHYLAYSIAVANSAHPEFLGAYTMGVQNPAGTFWPDLPSVFAAADPTYFASLAANFAGSICCEYAEWAGMGLAMAKDQGVPGAAAAWAWYYTNGYSLPGSISNHNVDPRWAIVPRTDSNVLPPQSTATPP